MDKVRHSVDKKEALLCIGYHLPDVTIKQANFTKPVYFSNADLACVDFSETEFSRGASFGSAKFSGVANFSGARFHAAAKFEKVRFVDIASFKEAEFLEAAKFTEVTFSKEADFISAQFSFISDSDFSHAKFLNEVRFSEGVAGSTFNGETLFRYTIFEQPNKAIFDTSMQV